MFLEIKSIEKYYGTGENRTKVLPPELRKARSAFCSARQVRVSQPCSTLSAV